MIKECLVVLGLVLTGVAAGAQPPASGKKPAPPRTDAKPTPMKKPVQASADSIAAPLAPAGNDIVQGLNQFAFDLYARLRESKQDANVFYSPYSISTALAMTYAGARGETAEQMARVMHLPNTPDQVHTTFGDLHRQLLGGGKPRGFQLHTANALWLQQGQVLRPDYMRTVLIDYQGDIREGDFKKTPEAVRETINRWVEDLTRKMIVDFLPPGRLKGVEPPLWVNAIYFKSAWHTPFNPKRTEKGPFFSSAEHKVDAQMMYQKHSYRYLNEGTAELLEMPYKGDELSMLLLLPAKRHGLAAVEKDLSAAKLAGWRSALQRLKPREVEVTLPRFKLTGEAELGALLRGMGMELAFSPDADFSGIHPEPKMFMLATVLHKAVVEVNEEGTEAAAATGVMAKRSLPKDELPHFKADQPFCFFIVDQRSGIVLFAGRCVKP